MSQPQSQELGIGDPSLDVHWAVKVETTILWERRWTT